MVAGSMKGGSSMDEIKHEQSPTDFSVSTSRRRIDQANDAYLSRTATYRLTDLNEWLSDLEERVDSLFDTGCSIDSDIKSIAFDIKGNARRFRSLVLELMHPEADPHPDDVQEVSPFL
jgi:hypothetical protein